MTFQVTTKHSIFLPGEHLKYLHFFAAQRRQISIPGRPENQVRWSGCDRNNLLEYKDGDDQEGSCDCEGDRGKSQCRISKRRNMLAMHLMMVLILIEPVVGESWSCLCVCFCLSHFPNIMPSRWFYVDLMDKGSDYDDEDDWSWQTRVN